MVAFTLGAPASAGPPPPLSPGRPEGWVGGAGSGCGRPPRAGHSSHPPQAYCCPSGSWHSLSLVTSSTLPSLTLVPFLAITLVRCPEASWGQRQLPRSLGRCLPRHTSEALGLASRSQPVLPAAPLAIPTGAGSFRSCQAAPPPWHFPPPGSLQPGPSSQGTGLSSPPVGRPLTALPPTIFSEKDREARARCRIAGPGGLLGVALGVAMRAGAQRSPGFA